MATWHVTAAAVSAAVATMVAIGAGMPVLGHSWQPVWLVALAVPAGCGLTLHRWWARGAITTRTLTTAAAASGVAVALFAIGAASSVVVDGRVVATTSETAQASRYLHQVEADLHHIATYHELIRLPDAEARSRLSEYRDGANQLASVSQRYARPGDLPAEEFRILARQVTAAAYFGQVALTNRADLTLQADSKLAADLQVAHEGYVQQTLAAGDTLGTLATSYGLSVGADPQVAE